MRKSALFIASGLVACGLAFAGPADATEDPRTAGGRSLVPLFSAHLQGYDGGYSNEAFSCPKIPQGPYDLMFQSMYGDLSENRSIIDPEAHEKYTNATESLNEYQGRITGMANHYLASSPRPSAVASCALKWMKEWAEDDAFLGEANSMGESVRKWALSSISLTYMQIRGDPSLDPANKRRVENWIRKIAKKVMADYSEDTHKKSRMNNHLYWAAWSIGAASIAVNDQLFFNWAVEKTRLGIMQVTPEGMLPLELARGRMALNYHVFAAGPLVMMAEAAQRNGINLFHENDRGIARLVDTTLSGLADPRRFQEAAGEKQDISRSITPSSLAWLEIYVQHYDSRVARAYLDKLRPMKYSRYGGNLTFLAN